MFETKKPAGAQRTANRMIQNSFALNINNMDKTNSLASDSTCPMGSGCQAIMDGIGNKIDYDSGVDYCREHGMNRKDAERNAYEDQMWDNMC